MSEENGDHIESFEGNQPKDLRSFRTPQQPEVRKSIESELDSLQGLATDVQKVQQLIWSEAFESRFDIDAQKAEIEAKAAEKFPDDAEKRKEVIGRAIGHIIDEKQASSLEIHGVSNMGGAAFINKLQELNALASEHGIALHTTVRYVFASNPKAGEEGIADPEHDLIEIKASYKPYNSFKEGRKDIMLTLPAAFLDKGLADLAQTVDEDGKVAKGPIESITRNLHDKNVRAFLKDHPDVEKRQNEIDTWDKLEAALTEANADIRKHPLIHSDANLAKALEFMNPEKIPVDQLPESLRKDFDDIVLNARTSGIKKRENFVADLERQFEKPPTAESLLSDQGQSSPALQSKHELPQGIEKLEEFSFDDARLVQETPTHSGKSPKKKLPDIPSPRSSSDVSSNEPTTSELSLEERSVPELKRPVRQVRETLPSPIPKLKEGEQAETHSQALARPLKEPENKIDAPILAGRGVAGSEVAKGGRGG